MSNAAPPVRRPDESRRTQAPAAIKGVIPMTAIATVSTTSTSSNTARPSVRGVLAAGTISAAVGAAVLYVYGTIAQAIGGKMHAGDPGADHAVPVPPSAFSVGVVFCTALGTVLAVILARRAAAPARTFIRTALVLTVVSLVPALLASHTDEATRLTLACGHLLAASVVIPILARRLSR
jgi:uncharacterized protein DUF6069